MENKFKIVMENLELFVLQFQHKVFILDSNIEKYIFF